MTQLQIFGLICAKKQFPPLQVYAEFARHGTKKHIVLTNIFQANQGHRLPLDFLYPRVR